MGKEHLKILMYGEKRFKNRTSNIDDPVKSQKPKDVTL